MESLERKNRKIFKILSVSVHAVGAVHFIFGCYYDWVHVNIPPEVSPIFEAFGYKLKFLTYWNGVSYYLLTARVIKDMNCRL